MTTITTATHTITAHYEIGDTSYTLNLTADTLEGNVQDALAFFNDETAHGSNRDFKVTDRDTDKECGTITIEGTVTADFWGNDNGEEDRSDDQITAIIEWDEK